MTNKEKIIYLINGVINNSYDIETFCDEFTRIYDLEINYKELTDMERKELHDLCEMASRYSGNEYELSIPNMYCSGTEILKKVTEVKAKLYD